MSPKEPPEKQMDTSPSSPVDQPAEQDPHAELEKMLISEYLRERGFSRAAPRELPREQAESLMKEASRYASVKLAELESRAHLVDEVHKAATPLD